MPVKEASDKVAFKLLHLKPVTHNRQLATNNKSTQQPVGKTHFDTQLKVFNDLENFY